jgi:hypothetical protein
VCNPIPRIHIRSCFEVSWVVLLQRKPTCSVFLPWNRNADWVSRVSFLNGCSRTIHKKDEKSHNQRMMMNTRMSYKTKRRMIRNFLS